jgi:NAD(P)-dependent dehydrogenase (short-subunit alcohol dehydrogenase family)
MGLLDGKVAVVTGAGAGLGRAVALALAGEGARVYAVSLVESELAEVRNAAAESALPVETLEADVGDEGDTERVARTVLDAEGRIDILVNNAGIIAVKPIEETTPAEWDKILRTNLRGPYLYCRAFVASMKEQRSGLIVNVTSMSGVQGFVGEAAYCPSKFGLEGLTKTLALELEPWSVRVCSIHPGMLMRTPMSMTTYDDEAKSRWVDPAEIAPGFVQLALTDGQAISGDRFDAWELAQRQAGGARVAADP